MKKFVGVMKFFRDKAVFAIVTAVAMIVAIMVAYSTSGFENYAIINFVVVSGIGAIVWGVIGIICAIVIRCMPDRKKEGVFEEESAEKGIKKIYVTGILWDAPKDVELPTEVEINITPETEYLLDEISDDYAEAVGDYLADKYGWCNKGFALSYE